jgi:hypothetical protein
MGKILLNYNKLNRREEQLLKVNNAKQIGFVDLITNDDEKQVYVFQ